MFSDEYVLSTVVATPEVKYDNFLRFLLYIGKNFVTSFESVREANEWQPTHALCLFIFRRNKKNFSCVDTCGVNILS